jgi:glycosyltransferase involved in cell wall biosynthesis
MTDAAPTLAVVVKGWPRLSETFIAQELVALERRGHRLSLHSLRAPGEGRRHPLHDALRAPVHYLPEYLHEAPLRVLRGWLAARRMPGFGAARRAWLRDLRRDPTRNRVRRFGQACVLAAEMAPTVRAIYAHFLHTPASVARYGAAMRGLPWAFSAHAKDIWTTPEAEKRDKMSGPLAARFGVTCTAYGAAHLRSLAAQPGRIDLAYHGLDLNRFPAPPDHRPPRDGRAEPVVIVSVGRLVEKKGTDRLLAALARLPAGLAWRFVHIGGGDLAEPMRALAESLGIAGRVEWRGAADQPAVIAALREADVFVLASRVARDGDRDGLPNVLMEAASQALAILSTPVAAIPEFVTDGVEGVLSSDEPDALSAALGALIADPGRRARLGRAAHARLVRDFGIEAGLDRLDARLSALLAGAA